jgi:hypothetical protein
MQKRRLSVVFLNNPNSHLYQKAMAAALNSSFVPKKPRKSLLTCIAIGCCICHLQVLLDSGGVAVLAGSMRRDSVRLDGLA